MAAYKALVSYILTKLLFSFSFINTTKFNFLHLQVFLLVVFGMAVAAPKETTNFKDAQVAETQQVVVESQKISPVQYKSASDLKTSETQETQKESLETSESFGLGYYAGHHLGLAAIPDALPLGNSQIFKIFMNLSHIFMSDYSCEVPSASICNIS